MTPSENKYSREEAILYQHVMRAGDFAPPAIVAMIQGANFQGLMFRPRIYPWKAVMNRLKDLRRTYL